MSDRDTDTPPAPRGPVLAELGAVVAGLRSARQQWRASQGRAGEAGGRDLPSREILAGVVEGLRGALFPMRLGPHDLRPESEDYYVGHTLASVLAGLHGQVALELRHTARHEPGAATDTLAGGDTEARARRIVAEFAQALPAIRTVLDSDVLAAFRGDPAARSVDEVLLCYPGIRATISHRIAHELYRLGVPLLARVIAELAHAETGVDIHPGATIAAGFFIDHGTGVVIGETAVIGERVRIYQNVTLGAKSFAVAEDGSLKKGQPRHPVVEDEVVIYAGATVLGRVTIGRGSVIGGNVWLTHGVPPGSQVSQADTQSRPA
ncbi:Serine acetyltransferase, plasmid [Rubrivivax sp. A210]|uniref:serine O-acetyltransferase EpsC n=1 Tax=Rubrivivax sp. A210 TaxID=2772301 RepID=UPI001918302C|nr:serine O-acetyltransferase EpsC [Rubrivivax sp. A210]CAD5371995.1 Serine acetyltransferase, plasmid [Rubrivivax sp. A210]